MFNISDNTKHRIIAREIRPADLVLQQAVTTQGRVWEIRTREEISSLPEDGITREVVARGDDLEEIFKHVANGESLADKFKELQQNRQFRLLSRNIPGMETIEHRRKVQTSIHDKIGRVKTTLKEMVKGKSALRAIGKSGRMIDSEYALAEIVLKNPHIPSEAVRKLGDLWKASDTSLDFNSWLTAVHDEWREITGDKAMFLPWLTSREWDRKEKQAWSNSHPGKAFDLSEFSAWQRSQYDPDSLLAEPNWMLLEEWEKKNAELRVQGKPEIDFAQWKIDHLESQRAYWEWAVKETDFLPFTHVDDGILKILNREKFEYQMKSGSSLNSLVWIAKDLWEKSGVEDISTDAFMHHLESQQYQLHQSNPNRPRMDFPTWKRIKEEYQQVRWIAAKKPLTFEKWKSQQILNPLLPAPFVKLNAVDRKAYQAECVGGFLFRKGEPLSTSNEVTVHSGKGWAIFVISPQEKLYCGSHLPGVFHHSSFLGDGAIMAAGEIRTDESGKITHISSKSGHYKPTSEENIELLRWFQKNGANLSEVSFTYFLADGSVSLPINARVYLDTLESSKSHAPYAPAAPIFETSTTTEALITPAPTKLEAPAAPVLINPPKSEVPAAVTGLTIETSTDAILQIIRASIGDIPVARILSTPPILERVRTLDQIIKMSAHTSALPYIKYVNLPG